VVVLEQSTVRLQLELPGEVEGSRDALLAAANGGYVERVYTQRGATVRKGDRIAAVDTSLFAAQEEQATAQAEQAAAELERLGRLGDLASEQQRLQAVTSARVTAAGARQAQVRLRRATVSAPFDGVIADVGVEVGEAAGPGAPVARLVQLDPILVTLSVSDRDVGVLQVGDTVDVWSAASAKSRVGRIRHVAPAADMSTRAFPVDIELENADHAFLPGMIARVAVDRPVGEGVVIPQDWLITRRTDRGVFIDAEGVAQWRPIVLGDVVHDDVIVLGGLSVGDRVIVTGHRELMDGDSLILSRVGTCCSAGRPVYE
jgi:membrane fusion protein (multidrug efflux system)